MASLITLCIAITVYNLCAERDYPASYFDGRVAKYGFLDHNPCVFDLIDDFCRDVHDWLNSDAQNVAVIHCKAGKGRTGLLIACYMLYVGLFPTALQALKYYGQRRTKNSKGVTIPSQIRYVNYYERYLRYERLVHQALQSLGSGPASPVGTGGPTAAAGAAALAVTPLVTVEAADASLDRPITRTLTSALNRAPAPAVTGDPFAQMQPTEQGLSLSDSKSAGRSWRIGAMHCHSSFITTGTDLDRSLCRHGSCCELRSGTYRSSAVYTAYTGATGGSQCSWLPHPQHVGR